MKNHAEYNLSDAIAEQPEAIRRLIDSIDCLSPVSAHSGIGNTVTLTARDGNHSVSLQLSYTQSAIDYAEIGNGGEQRLVSEATIDTQSTTALRVAQTLGGWGFRLTHADPSALMPVYMFVRGKQIPGKATVIGITAQLTTLDMMNTFGHGD